MLPIHTILFATDFSSCSQHALEGATLLAKDYSAHLIALHVVPQPGLVYSDGVIPPNLDRRYEFAQEELDRLPIPAEAERRLVEGDPVETILQTAQETSADLLVLGTHGRTGLGRLLMGSVAEQVLRRAPCPVLTVRTPFHEKEALHNQQMEPGLQGSSA